MKETKTSNPKPEFSDVTQSDPAARESFSQFEKNNDGTEIPYFKINKIEKIHHLLDYLSLNFKVKTLTVEVDSQVNEAARLLACNNTLTRLRISIGNGSVSLEGINQLLQNNILLLKEGQIWNCEKTLFTTPDLTPYQISL